MFVLTLCWTGDFWRQKRLCAFALMRWYLFVNLYYLASLYTYRWNHNFTFCIAVVHLLINTVCFLAFISQMFFVDIFFTLHAQKQWILLRTL
jgi:hypothetical protein